MYVSPVPLFPNAVGPEPHSRYLPVMISRIMLSLKKAAASQGDYWSLGDPSSFTGIRFADTVRGREAPGDEVPLEALRARGREKGRKFSMMS